jgi:hypothetical protein
MTLEDFDVVGYYPEPAIRMQMAVWINFLYQKNLKFLKFGLHNIFCV